MITRADQLIPEDLNPEAFLPFGDVITTGTAAEQRLINDGHTVRFHNLAALSLTADKGVPLVSIFRSTPLPLPLKITTLERHPLSSQAFYPLSDKPYLVIVAPAGELREQDIRVFRACGQGVNYHPGTWHHYSLALDSISDFLVIDRGGPDENCDEITLSSELIVNLEI